MTEIEETRVLTNPVIINMTDEQKRVADSVSHPFFSPWTDDGVVRFYDIRGDYQVALYTVQPDGSFTVDSLESGMHCGWTTFDSEGYVLDENGDRLSDFPDHRWG